MAVRLSTSTIIICRHSVFPNYLANRSFAYSFLHPPPPRGFPRLLAVSSGVPPPQPDSDPSPPPSDDDPDPPPSGVASKMSRLQDKVQIFFAVLFWMSLFFWSSAWDGNNNNKNERPDKGSRFRR